MEKLLTFPIELILAFIGTLFGYQFLRWLVDKVSLGKATEHFDNSRKKWMLGQFGQLMLIIGFLAIINLIVFMFRT
jgi:H+/Cl- antiporter ClcA